MMVSKPLVIESTNRACFSWLDKVGPILEDSRWGPALDIAGIPLLEALLIPLSLELLSVARDARTQRPRRRWRERAMSWLPPRIRDWVREQRNGARYAHGNSQPAELTEVVFWPRMPNHAEGHVPVAKALRQMGHTAVFVVDHPRLMPRIRRLGMEGVYHRSAWPAALRRAREQARKLKQILEEHPGKALPPFAGKSESEVLNRVRRILQSELTSVAEIIASVDEMMRNMRPRVVMVGNDLTQEGHTVTLCLRKRGVASASLMHGSLSGEAEHERHVVDRFFAYGNAGRTELLRCGAPVAQVEVTGATYIPTIPQQSGQIDRRVSSYVGLQQGQPWILVATSGPGHMVSRPHHLAVLAALAELSAAIPEIPIVVKLHRKDEVGYYEDALTKVPGAQLKVIAHDTPGLPDDIWSWFQGCSLVITGASTAGIEALLMDVPVVTVDLTGELSSVDFIAADITPHVRDGRDLPAMVRSFLDNSRNGNKIGSKAKAFLADTFASFGPEAARLTAQKLLSLADASSPVSGA